MLSKAQKTDSVIAVKVQVKLLRWLESSPTQKIRLIITDPHDALGFPRISDAKVKISCKSWRDILEKRERKLKD